MKGWKEECRKLSRNQVTKYIKKYFYSGKFVDTWDRLSRGVVNAEIN